MWPRRSPAKSAMRLAAPAAAVLVLAACATGPAYRPREPGSSIGYTDERLGPNRYRVTYSGGSTTRREKVEDFLLLRAAEVTRQSGFRYFVFDTRDTEARTTYFSTFHGWPGWRSYGWYWHSWPLGYDEFEDRPITRYQAYAEIVMLTAEQAQSEPRALDADEVVRRLSPPASPPPADKPNG